MDASPGTVRRGAAVRTRLRRGAQRLAVLFGVIAAVGCASGGGAPHAAAPADSRAGAEAEAARTAGDAEAGRTAAAEADDDDDVRNERDPWETPNRGIFWFNETADIYVILPIAKGWRFVTPSLLRRAVRNVSDLSRMSVILANNMLQLQPRKANEDVFRIVYNVTFGLGGLIDVATMVDIPENDEDFGQTLAFWGAPAGPYIVLPIFGPSTVRHGVGRAVDAFGTLYSYWLPLRWLSVIVNAAELLNLRAYYIEEVDENRRESFDYYVFMRDAYLQNRAKKLERSLWIGREEIEEREAQAQEDLYYIDEYDDEYEDEPDAGGGAAADGE